MIQLFDSPNRALFGQIASNSRPVNQDACYLTALNGTPLDVNSFAEPMG